MDPNACLARILGTLDKNEATYACEDLHDWLKLLRDMDEENWPVPEPGVRVSPDRSYRVVISDHGNVTLYHRGREVWGVV